MIKSTLGIARACLTVLALAAILQGLTGLPRVLISSSAFASGAPELAKCPVTPSEAVDPEIFTDYQGTRIFFCCDRCRVKFLRDPSKYIIQHASAAPENAPKFAHLEPDHSEHSDDQPGDSTSGSRATGEDDHNHADSIPTPGTHDHKEHGPNFGPRWQKWLGGFHPAMVNFPIGVLTAGALAEVLFIARRRSEFEHAARFCVWFAVATGVVAGILGWLFAGVRLTDADSLLATHRWLGTATVLWMLMLLWASETAHRSTAGRRGFYRFLLFGGTALVTVTGFFGGAMVYGLDHYLWH